jgi:lipopolysaccharide export system protein LptA
VRSGTARPKAATPLLLPALLALLALVIAAAGATSANAQQPAAGPCLLDLEETPTNHIASIRLPSGRYNSYIGGSVVAHCRGQGNTIKADSAEHYDDTNLLYLIGHVHYTEPRLRVDSDHMTYYQLDGRLIAERNVFAVMPTGTTLRGPWVEYLRALPGVRTVAHMTATGRPHLHLAQRDTTVHAPDTARARSDSTSADTAGIDANRIAMDGDSMVYASGQVIILRTDLKATSDSATFDNATGFARLLRTPLIEGTQSRHPFTLRGSVIDIYSSNHELQRVVAKQNADAVSQDLHLTSDTIDLRLTDKQLSRAYAWGPSRAHATTPERDVLADSLDAIMPHQLVREMRAIRKAYATSVPDTTKIKSKERDWMKGDTILAEFDSTQSSAQASSGPTQGAAATRASAPGVRAGSAPDSSNATQQPPALRDSSAEPAIKTLTALKDAQALYQLVPKDRHSNKPALNYVRGRVITIEFANRQVHLVTVVDSASGLYLEPAADSAAADSARAARKAAADSARSAKRRAKARKKGAAASPAPADSSAMPSPAPSATPPGATPTTPTTPPTSPTPAGPAPPAPAETAPGPVPPRDRLE